MEPKRYVDVNIFVYWLGGHPTFGERAKSWISNIEKSRRRTYYTSILTIYETIIIIAGILGRNLRDHEIVERIINAFSELEALEVIPLTRTIAVEALKTMKKYGLDYEDSVHLATALAVKASEIVSHDKDFDKASIKRVF